MPVTRWTLKRRAPEAELGETLGIFVSRDAAEQYALKECQVAGPWQPSTDGEPVWTTSGDGWDYLIEQVDSPTEPTPHEVP